MSTPTIIDASAGDSALLDQIASEAGAVEASGPVSFLLHEDAVWLVRTGSVDVFATVLTGKRPAGIRTHLTRITAGAACFGVPCSVGDGEYGLLAVAAGGTELARVPGVALRQHAGRGAWRGPIRAGVERWADSLCATLTHGSPPGRYVEIDAAASRSLSAGALARPVGGVRWLTPDGPPGAVCVGGAPDLALDRSGPTPLSPAAWLAARADVVLTAKPEQEASWSAAEAWEGLGRLHRLVSARAARQAADSAATEVEHQRRRAAANRATIGRACAQLLAPLRSRRPGATDDERHGADGGDPLLAACRLVGHAVGVTIKPYATQAGAPPPRDPLAAIARVSRIRTRQVALRGIWWRAENGPLLGSRAENGQPVALLPERDGYVLVDPTTRQRAKVTETVAATLKPFAHTFYRPFPDHPLTARDVMRFGFAGCQRDLGIMVMMGVIGVILGMFPSVATGWIFNDIIPGAERVQLWQLTIVLVVCAFATAMLNLVRSIALLRIEGRMGPAVQAAVWDRLLALPMPFFRPYASGDLAVRAMGIDQIRQVISGATATVILGGMFSLFNFGLMFWYSTTMAWWATLLIFIACLVTAGGVALQLRPQRGVFDISAKLSGTVLQLLTSVGKLRVGAAETQAFARWAERFGKQRTLQFRVRVTGNVVAGFSAAFPLAAYIVIFYTALPLMGARGGYAVKTGDFLAFLSAFGACMGSLLPMTAQVLSALSAIPLYEQVRPILHTRPEVDVAKLDPGALAGDIEVQHLVFRYRSDGPPVLRDVSFKVKAGEFVALVGRSGSGKSTILRLLLGFEVPESGLLYYDGQDLAGLDVQAVRRQIGVVLQTGRLLSGDIFTNIAGSSSVTHEDAWEAARMAGLAPDIEAMPMGMHTVVSEGGGALSGGQRQRLLIARAIVNRPRLLLFDEATSALDNRTQDIVRESLARLQATRLVIAHRLSTVMNADQLHVVQHGRIVQSGTYKTLINEPGLFAELAQRQLA
jgi:ATP-binding cassette subfamily C protein